MYCARVMRDGGEGEAGGGALAMDITISETRITTRQLYATISEDAGEALLH
jgi:hypothetical protein